MKWIRTRAYVFQPTRSTRLADAEKAKRLQKAFLDAVDAIEEDVEEQSAECWGRSAKSKARKRTSAPAGNRTGTFDSE